MATINTPKASTAFNGAAKTHGFEYKIEGGAHTPYLELHLKPGKAIISETGTMMMKSNAVEMKPVLGDGSAAGFFSKAVGVLSRKLGGENMLLSGYENTSETKNSVLTLAPAVPGEIAAIDLADHGGEIMAQRGSFLAAPRGIELGFGLKLNGFGLLGGEGVVMQKIKGDDFVFLNAGGSFNTIQLEAGETIDIDTGCLVAASKDVKLSAGLSGGLLTMMFGGEGIFLAKATGPGTVWTQSMPFQRQVAMVQGKMTFPKPK